jgi:hypothetical protein
VIGEKHRYCAAATPPELVRLLREGAATVGMTDLPAHPSELAGLQALAAPPGPGDVLALMAPAERAPILAWLTPRARPCSTPTSSAPGSSAARAG